MFWTFFLPIVAFLSALIAHLYFYVQKPQQWQTHKIQADTPLPPLMQRERRYAALSFVLFACIGYATDWLIREGYSQLYTDWSHWTYFYLPVSLVAVFFVQDAYFYWTHRLLHWKPLYHRVHSWHHRFQNPSPFSAFAFHPLEGIIQIGFVPLLAVLFPVHQAILVGYTTFVLVMSVYGHTGYELRAGKARMLHLFNTSVHHNQHHSSYRYNFGIFLHFWDRIMGTTHPDYTKTFEQFPREPQED